MAKTRSIAFGELRRFLEELGYRHKRVNNAELFVLSDDRMLVYPLYRDREILDIADISSTRRFLDAWGQMNAVDFDAFVESTTK